MSVGGYGNSGKGVVTEGLIFCIDPYNTKSYVSGGTTVYDLKTSTVSAGTFVNGVTFTDNYFEFDGTNDHILVPTGTTFAGYQTGIINGIDVGDDRTFEVWVNMPDASGTGGNIFANGGNDNNPVSGLGPSRGWSLGMSPNVNTGNGIIGMRMYKDGSNNRTGITTSVLDSADTWYHIVWVMYGVSDFNVSVNSNWDCYVNGEVVTKGTPPGDGGTIDNVQSINPFLIGARPGADPGPGAYPTIQSPFLGKLGLLRIYKGKAFTSDEAKQNYDATRWRFR